MLTHLQVPPGVLSVLPGYGASTGKELASNPLIRKVDITVGSVALICCTAQEFYRPEPRQVGILEASLVQIWQHILQSSEARYAFNFFHGHDADIDIWQAPIVVFNDADLLSAVNGVAFASFVASGQTCVSGARIIVQDQIYDEFLRLFLRKVDSITRRMGNRACFVISFVYSRRANQTSSQPRIHHGLCNIRSASGAD